MADGLVGPRGQLGGLGQRRRIVDVERAEDAHPVAVGGGGRELEREPRGRAAVDEARALGVDEGLLFAGHHEAEALALDPRGLIDALGQRREHRAPRGGVEGDRRRPSGVDEALPRLEVGGVDLLLDLHGALGADHHHALRGAAVLRVEGGPQRDPERVVVVGLERQAHRVAVAPLERREAAEGPRAVEPRGADAEVDVERRALPGALPRQRAVGRGQRPALFAGDGEGQVVDGLVERLEGPRRDRQLLGEHVRDGRGRGGPRDDQCEHEVLDGFLPVSRNLAPRAANDTRNLARGAGRRWLSAPPAGRSRRARTSRGGTSPRSAAAGPRSGPGSSPSRRRRTRARPATRGRRRPRRARRAGSGG